MRDRIDEFFEYCKKFRKDAQGDWDYIMDWIDDVTSREPASAGYVIGKLAELLNFHGHNIDRSTLEAYANAGWILSLGKEDDAYGK